MDKANRSAQQGRTANTTPTNTPRRPNNTPSTGRQNPRNAAPPAAQVAQEAPSLARSQSSGTRAVQSVNPQNNNTEIILQLQTKLEKLVESQDKGIHRKKEFIAKIDAAAAIRKKLDVSFNLLMNLLTEAKNDSSSIGKIVKSLNEKDQKTQKTLIQQFENAHHEAGLAFLRQLSCNIIPAILKESQSQDFKNLNNRQTVLDILSLIIGRKSTFIAAYGSNKKKDIERIEAILMKILWSHMDLEASKTARGVFQLAQVINADSVDAIGDHLFGYFNALDEGAWVETSAEQFSLYFAYGFLGKSTDILGRVFSCLQACPLPEFKAQVEQKITTLFGYFLDDFHEQYIRDLNIQPNAYDTSISYACKALPKLVDKWWQKLSLHIAWNNSILLHDLLGVKNSEGQCFLDFIYCQEHMRFNSNLEISLMCSPEMINSVGSTIQRLELPNVLQHVLHVPIPDASTKGGRVQKLTYLLLSILLQDMSCIQRFTAIELETQEECECLAAALKHLMEYSPRCKFKVDELCFQVLELLKSLGVLKNLGLMSHILAKCLSKDLETDSAGASTPIFDAMVQNLQTIGFDLHYVDPATGNNIFSKASRMEQPFKVDNFNTKLLELKVNPFLVNKEGASVFTKLSCPQSILQILGLDQHPFSKEPFKTNILKNKRLKQRDPEGRTPLIFYVMVNDGIKDVFGNNLEKLNLEDLEAKDNKGWTVFDYAKHNNDQETLRFLNERKQTIQDDSKRLLERKSKRRSVFSQAAAAFKLATTQVPQTQSPSAKQTPSALKNKDAIQPLTKSQKKRERQKRARAPEGVTPSSQGPVPEITIDYNPETGTSTTSITSVRREAAEAIEKAEAKQKKKEEKATLKAEALQPNQEKKGLFNTVKRKTKAVVEVLDTARKIATNPSKLARSLAENLQKKANPERLMQSETVLRLSKTKAAPMLEDGFWLGSFASLSDLANEALGKGLLSIPSSGVIKTLEAMDHAISIGKSTKINRLAILEAMQWALGGSIEGGHGSHINFRWQGGVFTIPQNKDGSDHADILYIKKAAVMITQGLRSLLLRNAATHSTLSSAQTSEGDESNLHKTSEASSIEDAKDETPEVSKSSEDQD